MAQVVNQDWVDEPSDEPSGKSSQEENQDSSAPGDNISNTTTMVKVMFL